MKKLVSFALENFVDCGLCQQNMLDYTSLRIKLNLPKMHCTTYKIAFFFRCFREWILND